MSDTLAATVDHHVVHLSTDVASYGEVTDLYVKFRHGGTFIDICQTMTDGRKNRRLSLTSAELDALLEARDACQAWHKQRDATIKQVNAMLQGTDLSLTEHNNALFMLYDHSNKIWSKSNVIFDDIPLDTLLEHVREAVNRHASPVASASTSPDDVPF